MSIKSTRSNTNAYFCIFRLASSELDKYSSLLLTTNVNGIKVDIEGDENLPLPDGLSDVNISNILRISWKEAHPPGLYVTLLKGFDRDVSL